MRSSANHETLAFADDDYILITQAIAAASSSSGDRELRDSFPSNREPLSNTLEQSCLENKDLASSKTYQDGNSRRRTRTIIAQLYYGTYDHKSSHHWIRGRRIPQWHQKFGTPSNQNLSMPNACHAMLVKPSQNATFTKTLSLPWHTPEDEKTCSESESEDDFQVQKMNHQSNSTEPSPRRCAWISDPRLIANGEKKKLVPIILRTRSRTSSLGHGSTDLRAGKKITTFIQRRRICRNAIPNREKKQRKCHKTNTKNTKNTHKTQQNEQTHTRGPKRKINCS
jgi:hypothetical protein